MADDVPFTKISISGPILSSLLQRFSSTPANLDGLLFGHVVHLPSPSLTDDDPSSSTPTSTPPPLSITITSFLSSTSPLSPFSPPQNPDPNPNSPSSLVGWFSARRHSPLRPSMRELSLSSLLSQTLTLTPRSCVFLLLSSFTTANRAVHTHEYRAYVLSPGSRLRPVSVDIVNVGPALAGQYEAFAPEAPGFPWLTCRREVEGEGEREGERANGGEVMDVEWSVEGFGVERMEGLVGEKAAEYTAELEELYRKMLGKLEGLARMVEKSSARVLDQETRNSVLRNKVKGLE
ncbi:uncharacterized protein M6B38_291420 [Iris pallida]|uniref:Uncharacterized protein n=1 Tax=Iris pallida TaxID=29817 RepID=A0AAX6HUR5_IRIPA|nr:uncharacterized protein M6B38_291420 [Iris pallida]